MEQGDKPKYRSLEELYNGSSSKLKRDGISFIDCLPGMANRTLLQRLAWNLYYHPRIRLNIWVTLRTPIEESDGWGTKIFKHLHQPKPPEDKTN